MAKIRLVFFDMEGTLFSKPPSANAGTCSWLRLAQHLGKDAYEAEMKTQSKWLNGQYSGYLDWVLDTIRFHKRHNLAKSDFERILDGVPFTPGVHTTFDILRQNEISTALVTGGFKYQADRAQRELKITHAYSACEYFWDNNGNIDHWNLLPGDYDGKVDFMNSLMREYSYKKEECVFVGDGDNDCILAQRVGASIAFNGTPKLQNVATFVVNQAPSKIDFAAILEHILV